MADSISFACGPSSLVWQIRKSDFLAALVLSELPFYGMMAGNGQYARVTIRSAAREFLTAVTADLDLLSQKYSFTIPIPVPGLELAPSRTRSSLGMAAIEIQSERYFLETGVGMCELNRYAGDPAVGLQKVLVRDLRQDELLPTDRHGVIRIQRRPVTLELPKLLNNLISFLDQKTEPEVTVKISWKEW